MPQKALLASTKNPVVTGMRSVRALRIALGCAMACFTLGAIQAAHAQSASTTTSTTTATTPAAPASWASTIKYSGEIDAGVNANFEDPKDGLNFGQSTTDHADQASLNALLLTVERDPDTSTSTFDWGFKVQGDYGSDARYYRYYGEFNKQDSRYMGEVLQAELTAHGGGLFAGGYDITVGQFTSPLGNEVIDPRGNAFYSHGYLFNYAVPSVATGGYVVAHPKIADVYVGMDTGVNTSIDNGNAGNSAPSYLVGLGKTVGNWTLLALSHFGPAPYEGNKNYRYYVDSVDSYKVNSKLTVTGEFDYVHDGYNDATEIGAGLWAGYALNSQVTLNARVEYLDDEKSFFVSNPLADNEIATTTPFLYAPRWTTASPTKYGEITLGVTYAPAGLPGVLSTLEFRPEIRIDDALVGTAPFGGNWTAPYYQPTHATQETAAIDADLAF